CAKGRFHACGEMFVSRANAQSSEAFLQFTFQAKLDRAHPAQLQQPSVARFTTATTVAIDCGKHAKQISPLRV
ncbi:MAG TPA: hypothetical protein VNB49_10115, partial [Candidatus Dormibacteraeota bacterium]|nr:hypothetical protein [Candidatus Dormibacteraeota bacterium]